MEFSWPFLPPGPSLPAISSHNYRRGWVACMEAELYLPPANFYIVGAPAAETIIAAGGILVVEGAPMQGG